MPTPVALFVRSGKQRESFEMFLWQSPGSRARPRSDSSQLAQLQDSLPQFEPSSIIQHENIYGSASARRYPLDMRFAKCEVFTPPVAPGMKQVLDTARR